MRSTAKTVSVLIGTLIGLHLMAANAEQRPHNLILFIPDGLRALMVTPQTAPTMAAIRDQGVNFANPHSLFPTFTMPNSSGLATGHSLGDTGVFSNTIYAGFPVNVVKKSVTPFIENDAVIAELNQYKKFQGNFINEESILRAAYARGYSTAAIGKLGPTLLFDHVEPNGMKTIIIDDSTGKPGGVPLSQEIIAGLGAAKLDVIATERKNTDGENGNAGNAKKPGTKKDNFDQQKYFVNVATDVVLPMFKARNKPFVLVFWSRDPDGTQHNQGDSNYELSIGINGNTSKSAIANADNNLKSLRDTLDKLGLSDSTNIVIAADHGFSTISKQSSTSGAAKGSYDDTKVRPGHLPPGFLAIDLAKALDLPLWDPDDDSKAVVKDKFPSRSNGLIGKEPAKPDVVVAANGGSDLIYVLKLDRYQRPERELTSRVVDALLKQDYVSGIFVDDRVGEIAGTLKLSSINLVGSAVTPRPTIVVSFSSSVMTDCALPPILCTATVADTTLQQGQGMHGSFSRADTMNFMAAIGPSFKKAYVDPLPVSNADVGMTFFHMLGLKVAPNGYLVGRVIEEAFPNGRIRTATAQVVRSQPAANELVTVLRTQRVGATTYFDVAGFPGRTVGFDEQKAANR